MRGWQLPLVLPRLRFFLRQAGRAMGRSLGVTTLAVLTMAISLSVLATFALVVGQLRSLAENLGQEVALSAYLDPGAVDGPALAADAAGWPGVARTFVLTSSQAMARFRTSLGQDAVLLDGLPDDIIPPSVEVELVPKPWPVSEVRKLAARLGGAAGVTDVRYGQDDLQRVSALLGATRVAAAVLGVALCFATILIIYNTIRLTLYARRDEIEIMSLVGATPGFIRAPFVLEGAIQGIVGGSLASAALFGLQEVILTGLERSLEFAGGTWLELELVPPSFAAAMVAAGLALGVVGSLLAVGKYLRL